MKAWKQYQEETADYFSSIGLEAETDVSVKGVRTSHDVDVLVTSHFHGFDIQWIVECKLWQKPVNKLHVLGLREIVADIGADRGILLSESGFQSGAVEAANMTNIQVTSLENVKESSSHSVYSLRLRELFDRVGYLQRQILGVTQTFAH
jgi:restriction system protein